MTIDELLDKSADELEKMSDLQLQEYFAPYLKAVRPDPNRAKREENKILNKSSSSSGPRPSRPAYNSHQEKMKKAQEILKRFNI